MSTAKCLARCANSFSAWAAKTLAVGVLAPSIAALHERTRIKFRQGKRSGDLELSLRIQSAETALMEESGFLDTVIVNEKMVRLSYVFV